LTNYAFCFLVNLFAKQAITPGRGQKSGFMTFGSQAANVFNLSRWRLAFKCPCL